MNVWDVVLTGCAVVFTIAPALGVFENFRKRRSWTKSSTVMMTPSMFVASIAVLQLGALLSAITIFIEAIVWTILMAQSFKWPTEASNTPKDLEK